MPQAQLSERQLECFHETVTTGSVRGAADRMNVEASVVSRHLKQLQARLGVCLLERRGRGVVPTPAARHLLDFCVERRAQEAALLERLAGRDGILRGRLHIVASQGVMDSMMRWVLGEFCAEHGALRVTLEQANARDAVERLAHGDADIGIAYCAHVDPVVDVVRTYRVPVCAVMREDHPCAGWDRLPLAEAARHRVALMTAGHGLQQIMRRACAAEGIELTPSLLTNSHATARQFAQSGLGISFMSDRSVGATRAARGMRLVARRTTSATLETADVTLLARAGWRRSPAMTRLLDFLEQKTAAWST